jgi:ATP-dependent DNA ligase
VGPDGITSFGMIQLASDAGVAIGLVFFLFDLLDLNGEDLMPRPLMPRCSRVQRSPLQYCDHQIRGELRH